MWPAVTEINSCVIK